LLNRVIITEEKLNQKKDILVLAIYENNHMKEVRLMPKNKKTFLGNIYIGRVKNIVENIQAAFIEIENGQICFASLKDLKTPLFTKKVGKKELCIGDELVVEVIKENVKTKPPVVSAKLNFTGKYLVLTTQNCHLGLSKKLIGEDKKRLQNLLEPYLGEDYGLIVRTNAKDAAKEELFSELKNLKNEYEYLKKTAIHKAANSLLRETDTEEIQFIKGLYMSDTEKIITDIPNVYEKLEKYLKEYQWKDLDKLELYEDLQISLLSLYNVRRELDRALNRKVWLSSGGYLVIEPTEALTVIDVNSGKNIKKISKEEMVFHTNIEAAKEIAKQLILRNISGICVVDFIDMKEKEHQEKLMHILRMELKKDKIPVTLVDITRLGLVELTRKKVQKSLREQVQGEEFNEW